MADSSGFDDEPALFDLGESAAQAEALADTLTDASRIFSRTLTSGMRAAVLEGRSLDSILKSAVSSFLSSAFRAGVSPLVNLLTQGLTGALGSIGGGVSGAAVQSATRLVPFAKGGVIGAPAAFPLPGGATGLAGEAGPEAIVPLARGADGALGIAMHGGRGGPPIVINIATPDIESFRRSEAQLTATLARAVGRGRRGI